MVREKDYGRDTKEIEDGMDNLVKAGGKDTMEEDDGRDTAE